MGGNERYPHPGLHFPTGGADIASRDPFRFPPPAPPGPSEMSFPASSNLRTISWHEVVLHMCFDDALSASENNVRPAARSTASTGEV